MLSTLRYFACTNGVCEMFCVIIRMDKHTENSHATGPCNVQQCDVEMKGPRCIGGVRRNAMARNRCALSATFAPLMALSPIRPTYPLG
jgi:hypothetical protein